MHRPIVVTALLAGAFVLGPWASPAGATVSATSSGTIVTVTMTGDGSAEFTCEGGKVAVDHVLASPALACSALTQVTVIGDPGNQTVYGDQLGDAAFSALPKLVATMGDGSDDVRETDRADQIDLGPGDDSLELWANGLANASVNLGTGSADGVSYTATASDDAITIDSTGATATIDDVVGGVLSVRTFSNAESLQVHALAGDDDVSATGVTAGSSLATETLFGDAGDDTLHAGALPAYLFGGDGANTLIGGPSTDSFHSESPDDQVTAGADGVLDYVYDEASTRSGGRTYTGLQSQDHWSQLVNTGDAVTRVRPSTPGTLLWTTSLTRTGQQVLPTTLGGADASFGFVGRPAHRGLFDAVATSVVTGASALDGDRLIADFTVPTGSWDVGTGVDYVEVDPTSAGLATMWADHVDDYRVHGPWTDKDKGFVHRATRDLLFRFAADGVRDLTAAKLANHTTTRAAVTASLMDTDEYRGLDVDRVFVTYLRRAVDPGGRTYWINSIRNGKALWRFRAQLLGSSEYFTKAGGTNADYLVAAYRDVLGRAPDPSGQAYWTAKLDAGADRGQIALKFINAPEEKRFVINEQFLRFLDRTATTAELATWVPRMAGATGEQDLIAFLVGSGSYYSRD